MAKHKHHRHRKSFWSSIGYYVVVAVLIICLALLVKNNRSQKAEREEYKESLAQEETEETVGNITITRPTNAPEDAVVRNVDASASEDGEEASGEESDTKTADSNAKDKADESAE